MAKHSNSDPKSLSIVILIGSRQKNSMMIMNYHPQTSMIARLRSKIDNLRDQLSFPA